MNRQNNNDIPADNCIFCNKALKEVGGSRIVSQKFRGVTISDKYQEGTQEYPRHSYVLSMNPGNFLVVWGEKELWTEDRIEKAKDEYAKGKRSWFCQVCGNRVCKVCGYPFDNPMGSDIMDDDGRISHIPIFPVAVRCSNPKCKSS